MCVREKEAGHWLVLGWPAADGELVVTWAFMLHEIDDNMERKQLLEIAKRAETATERRAR